MELTKQNLKDGMTMITRHGKSMIYSNDKFFIYQGGTYFKVANLDDYNDDFSSRYESDCDIMKVYMGTTLLWARKELLTLEDAINMGGIIKHKDISHYHADAIEAISDVYDMYYEDNDSSIDKANKLMFKAINNKVWEVKY